MVFLSSALITLHCCYGPCRDSLSNANHTAGKTAACIAGCFAEFVTSLSQVVYVSMYHNSAADNRVGSGEGDFLVRDVDLCDTCINGGHVAKVASVSVRVGGGTMLLAVRVEVGASTCTTVCVIAKLVYMEAMLTRSQTCQCSGDVYRVARLFKVDSSCHRTIAFERTNCLHHADLR